MTPLIDEAARQRLVATRRHFHQCPELSFEEFQTRDHIIDRLRAIGLEPRVVSGTGVVATLDSGRPGPTVAFRADMDALPLAEETGSEFSSTVRGVMHACGHDAHMAMLLTVAEALVHRVEELAGRVRFIFEPGEETNGGAKRLIQGGALHEPDVDRIFAIHVLPDLPAGVVGIKEGHLTGTDDEFTVTIQGRSVHSSTPHDGVNAIVVASHVVAAIHAIPSVGVDPFDVAAVSVCTIKGGEAVNVIPSRVELTGMIRCLDKAVKHSIRQQIRSRAEHLARAHDATAHVHFSEGYPAVINDPECTGFARNAALKVAGDSGVVEIPKPHLGSEDFSHFQEVVPGCMMILGCGFPDRAGGGLHTADMAFDEACLPVGAEMLLQLALDLGTA